MVELYVKTSKIKIFTVTFIEHLLCAIHSLGTSILIKSLIITTTLFRIEVQHLVICPKSQDKLTIEPGFELMLVLVQRPCSFLYFPSIVTSLLNTLYRPGTVIGIRDVVCS